MEKPPYVFQVINDFSIKAVEKKKPRIDYITKLTLEIGPELPKGKHSLELIKPFPPKCNGGEKLMKLKSLDHEDIESISACRYSNSEKNACIRIKRKAPGTTISVKCKRIEGVPGWNEKKS
jgi:hypothetical protein